MTADPKSYPAMKDSGVPWLGEVPEHWEVARLKSLLTRNDSGVWGEDSQADGTIVLRSTEQTVDGGWRISNPARIRLSREQYDAALLAQGDLVVTKSSGSSAHIGKTSLVTADVASLQCCFANFMQRLRPTQRLDSRLLWRLLNCPVGREQMVFRSTTTTGLGNLNGTILGECQVPLPPFPEQAAIVRFLDHAIRRIGRYIRAKQKLIKLLEEQKQAIIHRAVTRGLDPNVRLKPSGVEWLGDVPEHWEIKKFKHCLRAPLAYGVLKPDKHDGTDAVPIIRILDVSGGAIRRDQLERISLRQDAEFARTRVAAGDVLISVVGTIGRSVVVPSNLGHANLSRALCRVQLNCLILPEFLHAYCQSRAFIEQADSIPAGTAQRVLNLGDLRQFDIALPPSREQTEILWALTEETDASAKGIAAARQEIDLLREYRTRLIADVVTGKLDVREAAASLPDEVEESEPLDEPEIESSADDLDENEIGEVAAEAEA